MLNHLSVSPARRWLPVLITIATAIYLTIAAGTTSAVFSFSEKSAAVGVVSKDRVARPDPVPTCLSAPAGRIGLWAGNGNGDDSVGPNDVSMIGGGGFTQSGNVGGAFDFDNPPGATDGQFAQLTNPVGLPLGNAPRTVNLWFRTESDLSAATESALFEYGAQSTANTFGLITSGNAPGKLYFYGNSVDMAGVTTLQPNTWYFASVTYDGAVVKLYLNGQLENSATLSLNTVLDPNGLTIGNRPGSCVWNGQLDEVELYDRELSQTEIQAIYNAGSAGTCSGCGPMPDGMVGWWPGEGNANDVMGPTFEDGTLINGVTFAPGVVNQAFVFDGADDYVEVPQSEGIEFTRISLSFWFKLNELDRIHELVNKFGPEGSNTISYGSEVGTNNHACFRISTDGSLSTLTDLCTTSSLSAGQWYHFAGTYDGAEMRLYINGQNQGAVPKTGNIFTSNQSVRFGSYGYFPWFLNGSLDEVLVTGRALSESEIQAIYNAGSGGTCASCSPIPHGLVGWWPGEDNAEDVQRANHGQRVNGGTYDPGKIGRAFSFNQANSQYVSLPPGADNLLRNDAGAITVWVNPASVGDFDMIAAFGSSDPGQAIGLGIHNNIRVYHQGDAYDWLTNTPVTPGTWTFLAYTWDQTTEAVYKNGILAESRPRVNFNYVPGTTGRIGFGFINDPSVFFTGRIDELAIYDRAITSGEVSRVFSAGSNGMCNGCGASPAGLISWWPGEFNAEDANQNNFGSLVGGVGFMPGVVGNAFSFNGSSANVRIPDSPTLDVTNEFTLGAWVKPTVIPDYPNGALVISKVGPISNLNGYQMALTRTGGQNTIWCGFNESGGAWPQHNVTGGAVPLGEWTYVSCTYDHNTLAVQQNGVRVGSTVVGAVTVVNTSSDLRIGTDDVGQQFFNGLIDEPMVFGRALSDSELGSLFDNGVRGVCHQAGEPSACAPRSPGIISWWRAQNNAIDQTKRHHGTPLPTMIYGAAKVGNGFEFHAGAGGEDGVAFGDWFDLQLFTIEMWIKPKAGQVLYSNIVDNNHSSSPRRSWVLENIDNGNRFHWWSADFPDGVQLPFDLTPDLWHHVVISRDGSRITRVYVNRSFVGSFASTADIPYDGTQSLRLGNWFSGGRSFNGTIDEFTVYDRPLSESEIAVLFSANEFGKCAANPTVADFDGDLISDLSIYRPAGATGSEWWFLRSLDGANYAAQFGTPTDTIVAEDFTGDGLADFAFFRPSNSNWYILRSEDWSYYSFPFGTTGDLPVPADYDGDGIADPAVFRPSTGTWYVAKSTGGLIQERFGFPTDKPVPADYDGDGKVDIAIYRPSNGQWWINRTHDGLIVFTFGNDTDKNVPGDYTGDGKADVAIYRPWEGNWYIQRSEDYSYFSFPFGLATDIPAAGDFDGDGIVDGAVFRPSDGKWYLRRSSAGFTVIPFGADGDIPVPGAFIR